VKIATPLTSSNYLNTPTSRARPAGSISIPGSRRAGRGRRGCRGKVRAERALVQGRRQLGRLQVLRLDAPGPNSHFFTVNASECGALKSAQVTPRRRRRSNGTTKAWPMPRGHRSSRRMAR
jgi:hypothetical protein